MTHAISKAPQVSFAVFTRVKKSMSASLVSIFEPQQYEVQLQRAIDLLDAGKLVVLPTETVYGVAARLDRPEALQRLRALRPADQGHPFTIHLASRAGAGAYLGKVGDLGRRMMQKLWPGPVSLMFDVPEERRLAVAAQRGIQPSDLYANETITLRCPDHVVAEDVLGAVEAAGGAVVLIAVESSGDSASSPAPRLAKELGDGVDLVVDAGPTTYSKSSTAIHIIGEEYRVVRTGVYDERIIKKLLDTTLLFVCSGNTCRSAMAEGIARKILSDKLGMQADELGKKGINVISAGSFAMVGAPAAQHAVEILRDEGVDLSRHRSKPLTVELIHQADRIYTMSRGHAHAVAALVPSAMEKVTMLNPDGDIQDPVGADMQTYRDVASQLKTLIQKRLDEAPVL
jgi:protein-tyrosine phosphatase